MSLTRLYWISHGFVAYWIYDTSNDKRLFDVCFYYKFSYGSGTEVWFCLARFKIVMRGVRSIRVLSFTYTAAFDWRFFKIEHEQRKTAQDNSYG